MWSGTLSMNWELSNCASGFSSKVGSARRSRFVNFTANTNGFPSGPSFGERNCCIVSCLSVGLSNSDTNRSTNVSQDAVPSDLSTLSYAAFARPLNSVPSTTAFAACSLTPTNSATASKSRKKLRMSPSSNAVGHGIFIVRRQRHQL
ncbi:unnamed protein product [Trichobilharzia szidati]|nr:unnamed protein product [Trichobilharzia szidati]